MNTLTQEQLEKSIEVIASCFRLQLPATTLVQVDMDETAVGRELNAAFASGIAQGEANRTAVYEKAEKIEKLLLDKPSILAGRIT
jgi:hypothetical protein